MKLELTLQRNVRSTPVTDAASLEQDLKNLSSKFLQRSSELPLTHKEQLALGKLYAGAQRLHQAVKEGTVPDAIVEIGSNLMGCEQMALLLIREQWNHITFINSVGLDLKRLEAMRMNAKGIIEEAPADDVYIKSEAKKPDLFLSSLGVTAYVPFWLDSATKGAIVFFDLLPQRNGLDSGDRELLKLLCHYAGPCLSLGSAGQETLG
jgi:hypothetical protein